MNISKDYAISPEYEDTSWQPVELPHTYNSEDSTGRMTVADGETTTVELYATAEALR